MEYLARTLVALPYDVQEEPLFVVHFVSRLAAYEGSALLANFRQALRAQGASLGADDDSDGDVDQDGEDSDEDSKPLHLSPKKKGTGGPLGDTSYAFGHGGGSRGPEQDGGRLPLGNLKALAAQAMAMGMLLRVKHYLKVVYRLSDARCTEYAPTDSTKASEKPAHRPDK